MIFRQPENHPLDAQRELRLPFSFFGNARFGIFLGEGNRALAVSQVYGLNDFRFHSL